MTAHFNLTHSFSIIAFLSGFILSLGFATILKIIFGIKLNLYLVNNDTSIHDQNIIPITIDLKKQSLWRTLLNSQWKEDVELTLVDYKENRFTYCIGYHLLRGYSLKLNEGSGHSFLNKTHLHPGKLYFLKTGKSLQVGERQFIVLITTQAYEKVISSSSIEFGKI